MSLLISGGTLTGAKALWAAGFLHAFWFDVNPPAIVPHPSGSPTVSYVTTGDRVYRRESTSAFVSDFAWPYIIAPGRTTDELITRSSNAPSVVIPDPDNNDRWLYQSSGSATLTIASTTRTVTASVTTGSVVVASSYVESFSSFASGSLRAAVTASIDDVIAGIVDTYDPWAWHLEFTNHVLRYFSTNAIDTGTYIRNPECWANQLNVTGYARAGAPALAISPRHVLMARHYPNYPGAVLRFFTPDGSVLSRTLAATVALDLIATQTPDFTIGILDSDLPSEIQFAKVLPNNWRSKMSAPIGIWPSDYRVPVFCLDGHGLASIRELSLVTDYQIQYSAPNDAHRNLFYWGMAGGDSGSAMCLVIGGQMVVLSTCTYAGGGWGTNLVTFKPQINAAMTALGGGYQLTEIDLSAFPSY